VNSALAEEGTPVSARIDGVEYSATAVDDQGRYGYSSIFRVLSDNPCTPEKDGGEDDDTVEFYVNGALGGSATFESGGYTQLDLAVSGATAYTNTNAYTDTHADTDTHAYSHTYVNTIRTASSTSAATTVVRIGGGSG